VRTDVNDVSAVEHRERGGVAGLAREIFEVRFGEYLDVHGIEIGGTQLEHLGP
jgi:hypothetical protein